MRKLLFCLLITSTLFASQERTDAIFQRTDPETVKIVYDLLEVLDLIFLKHDITYWIDGGTLLGAVRHQGLIPWDDDGDVEIFLEDKEKVLALEDEFNALGYQLADSGAWLMLRPLGGALYPAIDIFLTEKEQSSNYYILHDETCQEIWPQNYWLEDEISTLVRLPFGPLMLNAPHKPYRYLFALYGLDVFEKAVYQSHHSGRIRTKVKLVDFNPAPYPE